MREYAKISPQFWLSGTGRKIKNSGQEATIVALYLLSSPHSNMLGLYYIPKLFISHETGLTQQGASKGLQRCIEAGFCDYDADSETVFVYEMARFQVGEQLKEKDNQVKGANNAYRSLPKSPFLYDLYTMYKDKFHLKEPRNTTSPFEGASKGLRSKEQEQEQEKEIRALASFEDFYRHYPKKKNKQAAEKAWKKINPTIDLLENMLSALEKHKQSPDWLKDSGQFIPYPASWLNGRRWEDETETDVKSCDQCRYKIIEKQTCWQEGRDKCSSYQPV